MNLHVTILYILLYITTINALNAEDIVFLIISQSHPYNIELASRVEENIKSQTEYSAIILLSDRDFRYRGDWTIFPLIPSILNRVDNFKWLFICTERTHINIEKLQKTLKKYNAEEEIWLGHALHDREATIIHHFAFSDNPGNFSYPNTASGFVISYPLVAKIAERYETSEHVDFSIDASHEFAMFLWNNGAGVTFKNDPNFCVNIKNNCATAVYPFNQCNDPIPSDSIYFGVKTCSKYHKTRVNVVQKTWADFTRHIEYFSDEFNDSIPTIALRTPNTERGHCAKTMEILGRAAKLLQNNMRIRWVVITDDDTIISPGRLRQFLSCYGDDSEPVVIGERYGYRVRDIPSMGYNYITGGGGMVFNRKAVFQLLKKSPDGCKCPKADAPDDMTLGACFTNMPAFIVHSPYFHQARPTDYAEDYLLPNEAISFHKHWMIDPVQVYKEWFYPTDRMLFTMSGIIKVEL